MMFMSNYSQEVFIILFIFLFILINVLLNFWNGFEKSVFCNILLYWCIINAWINHFEDRVKNSWCLFHAQTQDGAILSPHFHEFMQSFRRSKAIGGCSDAKQTRSRGTGVFFIRRSVELCWVLFRNWDFIKSLERKSKGYRSNLVLRLHFEAIKMKEQTNWERKEVRWREGVMKKRGGAD